MLLSSASCLTPVGAIPIQKPLYLFDPTAPSNKPLHLLPFLLSGPKNCSLHGSRTLAHSRCSVNKPQDTLASSKPALYLPKEGMRELTWEGSMPFRQGSATKAQDLSSARAPHGGGQRRPCPQRLPRQLQRLPRGVSKPGAGPATSVGTPPAHSILPWRPALFGQVTLTDCSTMLLHTPGLL